MKVPPTPAGSNPANDFNTDDEDLPAKAPLALASHPNASNDNFKVIVRGIHQPDLRGHVIEGDTPDAVLSRALDMDVSGIDQPVIRWDGPEDAVALDFDRPDDAAPLRDADVESIMAPGGPTPAHAWVTHGAGLRVIFHALEHASALALAGVWLMVAKLRALASWRLEIKTDTRHPGGLRDATRCGRVFRFEPSTAVTFGTSDGHASDGAIEAWLDSHGLTMGRHGAELCPWNPKASSGNPSLSVTERGVHCFHCGGGGSWATLVGEVDPARAALRRAARALVHLGHQRHVIQAQFPFVPLQLVDPAWSHLLREANNDRLSAGDPNERAAWEKRVAAASSGALDIARSSSGGWIDSRTLMSRKVSADKTLKHLPSCFWPPMVDKADSAGSLDGFIPIHPIGASALIGPGVLPPRGTLFARRPRENGDPPAVDVSTRPSPTAVQDAWKILEAALPGINRGYHCAIVATAIVAQRGVGTPPIICATGQSGSAKTAQAHLGAGAVGTRAHQIVLAGTDDTTRKAGLALEEGAGVLFADEVGRVEGVFAKLEPILAANSYLRYRPKYANERVAPMCASVLLLGSTLPEAIVRSPELGRRAVGYRLAGADKNWTLIDPSSGAKLDLADARRVEWLRIALDTITASVWWRIGDLGPAGDWRALLLDEYEAVPLPHLDLIDSDGTARAEAIGALYEAYRTAKPQELSALKGWVGWLIADPGTLAGEHLNVLVELDADKSRFKAATSDLERMNLGPILGFTRPQLQLLVHRRSPHILVKFVEVGVLRGKGTPRVDLPAAKPVRDARNTKETGSVTVLL